MTTEQAKRIQDHFETRRRQIIQEVQAKRNEIIEKEQKQLTQSQLLRDRQIKSETDRLWFIRVSLLRFKICYN